MAQNYVFVWNTQSFGRIKLLWKGLGCSATADNLTQFCRRSAPTPIFQPRSAISQLMAGFVYNCKCVLQCIAKAGALEKIPRQKAAHATYPISLSL